MFDFLFKKTEKLNLIQLYEEAIAFAEELGLECPDRTGKDKPLRFYVPNIKRSDADDYFMSIYMHKILGESSLPTDFACTRPAWERAKKDIKDMHADLMREYNVQLQALKQLQIFKSQMIFKA